MDFATPTQQQQDAQDGALMCAQSVQFSKDAISDLWTDFRNQYSNTWNPNKTLSVMTQYYQQMAAITTTYTSLAGVQQSVNNWQAMFLDALDLISIVQNKAPELLQNLPKFTDGSTMFLEPGWVLDPTTYAPVSAKVMVVDVPPP